MIRRNFKTLTAFLKSSASETTRFKKNILSVMNIISTKPRLYLAVAATKSRQHNYKIILII